MPENFANRYQTALAAGVTSGAATGTVTSVTGVPTVPFRAIISSEGANTDEIVLVTARAGTTLTWTRAAEAVAGVQTASAHAIGATFTAIVTAAGVLNGRLFDVHAYGALGDGSNDVVALQAAITAGVAVNGTVVFGAPAVRYGITGSLVVNGPVTLVFEGGVIRQSAWGVPVLEIRSADVRILGELNVEYTGSRTLFDGAALTASINSSTVKTECASDPKAAGAAVYLATWGRFYAERIRVSGFISAILYGGSGGIGPTQQDAHVGSIHCDTVDFGAWGTPGINNYIGAIKGRSLTRTQSVDEHLIYWTQNGTRSVGSYIGSAECDNKPTNTAPIVSAKSVNDCYIGSITGKNVGSLLVAVEGQVTVGYMSARTMTVLIATDNGASGALVQSNSDVEIMGCDIEGNVAGTDQTNKSRVFDCSGTSKLTIHSPRVRMIHATPGPVCGDDALMWVYDARIEYVNALPSTLAAFMPRNGAKSATRCLYVDRPYIAGSAQVVWGETNTDAYELSLDPNLINGGAPNTTTVVSGTATHHTRFIAELEVPQTIADGTTQPQIRGANTFACAATAGTAITKFQSGTNGQRFYVLGAANWTINDTVDIKTKGNANHALAAGEVVWFQYINGIAYELQNTV